MARLELQGVSIGFAAGRQRRKVLSDIDRDVDESLFLPDRVAMMTSGPDSILGGIVDVPFGRPRDRHQVFEGDAFEDLRGQLLGFREQQAHTPEEPPKVAASSPGFANAARQPAS